MTGVREGRPRSAGSAGLLALLELGGRGAPGAQGRGLVGGGAAQDHPRGRAGLQGGAGRESFPCHYPVVPFGPCHLTCLSPNFLFCRMDIMSLQQ